MQIDKQPYQKNGILKLIFEDFQQLDQFYSRSHTYLMGRAFYRLKHKYHLDFIQIADAFGFTSANVVKATKLFLKNQTLGSPTLASQELGTCSANVPPRFDENDSLVDIAGQTTTRESHYKVEKKKGKHNA